MALYTVAFDLRIWGEVDFFRLYRAPAVHRVSDFDTIAEPCRALVAELAAHGEAVTLVAEGWARILVGRWLDEIEAVGALLPAAGVDDRLSTALAAIDADLAGEWSLERLAGMMCLSTVRVRELFVRGVGLPPMRYITVHRMAHARALLQNTDLTCAEIARRCGFQDPAYFSRIFHRISAASSIASPAHSRSPTASRRASGGSKPASPPAPLRVSQASLQPGEGRTPKGQLRSCQWAMEPQQPAVTPLSESRKRAFSPERGRG